MLNIVLNILHMARVCMCYDHLGLIGFVCVCVGGGGGGLCACTSCLEPLLSSGVRSALNILYMAHGCACLMLIED